MKDGKKLLAELGRLGGPQVYFRWHHLLTSGDGAYALKWGSTSAYKEDTNGTPIYDWTIDDRIFDTYLERGLKPYVQLGFMPEALSTHPQNYPHHPPVNETADPQRGPGVSAEGLREVGRTGLSMGEALRGEIRRGRSASNGIGKSGTNRTSVTGRVRRRNFSSCTITRWPACGARCRRRGSAGRMPPAVRAEIFCGEFLEHCAHGTNYVTGTDRLAAGFHFLSRQGFAGLHERPRPHGNGQPIAQHGSMPSPSSPRFPNTKTSPSSSANPTRRLRGVPRSAGRLSQRHDVFQLHRREFPARI